MEQAGQMVNDKEVRSRLYSFSALTPEEITKVEQEANLIIRRAIDVERREMPIEEAKSWEQWQLFGEKYGDIVRVVSVGDYSREFCGGTHVDNTLKSVRLKIVSESSVAAGVRRIEAVTGQGVMNLLNNSLASIQQAADVLKLNNPHDLVKKSGANYG